MYSSLYLIEASLVMPAGITSEASIRYKDEYKLLSASDDVDDTYIEQVLPGKMVWNLNSIERFSFFREILTMLRKGRLSAGDIASHFDMTGATVSYHLKQLKTADLIYETKEKNFIYYSLNTSVFEEILLWVSQFTPDNTEKEVQEIEETEKK